MSDLIDRQAAIDEIDEWIKAFRESGHKQSAADARLIQDGIIKLSSAQPEIIRCRECKFASGDSRICMKFDHSPIGELDFCSFAERREDG